MEKKKKNRKKTDVKIIQLNQLEYILDRHTIYTERKKELISRDPLTKELLKKLDEYRPNKSTPSEKEIETIRQKLASKWNVGIIITSAAKPFVDGLPVIANQKRYNCLSPIKFAYDGESVQEMEPLIISNNIAGDPVTAFRPPCKEILFEAKTSELVLHVNLDLLDKADAKEVKRGVWAIIEMHLPKRKTGSRINEPSELLFIYNIKQDTFNNYLRWYDLNNEGETFSFRAIAFYDYVLQKRAGQYDDGTIKKKISEQTKTVKTARGERTLHGVIGEPVKGEDNVAKGVNLVWKAIYRKQRPKTTKQREYDCPNHKGQQCPKDCEFLKAFMKDFNRRNMLFKPLCTSDPSDVEKLSDIQQSDNL